ncbi:OmpA family protein [Promicromonospora sp. NPDC060271]|uniref:OmpA family protein n=1 Tax=Promicromonospora sp. NPDC060271 TaxID=3347089 RepID=UPI00364D1D9C
MVEAAGPAGADPAAVRTAVADAALHARAGRYDAARHLLDGVGGEDSDDVAVLDLLARVHAQRGDLVRADACWARVERLDPEHAGAADGRRRIRTLWSGKRTGGGLALGAAAACLLLAGGGVVTGWALASRPADQQADPAVAQELAELRHELNQIRTATPPPSDEATPDGTTSREAALRAVRDALGDRRWTTTLDARTVLVTFREPVFEAGGAETSRSGADVLTGLAGPLGDLKDVEVTVIGHTSDTAPVPGSRYRDNAEVSLARALAAAQVISSGSGIPLSAIDVAGAGDVDPPYPNTDEANRARNQTVTVAIEVVP